jgi:hypothetical protein
MHDRGKGCIQGFWYLKERGLYEDLDADRRIMGLREIGWGVWTGFNWLRLMNM